MNRRPRKAALNILWGLLPLLLLIFFPVFAPVMGIAVIGFYLIKGFGKFLDRHL